MKTEGGGTAARAAPSDAELVERMSKLPRIGELPRAELEWLAAHGRYELRQAGEVVSPVGEPIGWMYVVLSGYVAIQVDRGVGPKRVMEWHPGDVTGKVPYSRMKTPPGSNYVEIETEALAVPVEVFPELIKACPEFTAYTVHLMLDRARSFNTSDLQDEKMVALGKLAAGLAHELNNPASATVRSAKLLIEGLRDTYSALRALGSAGLSAEVFDAIEELRRVCQASAAPADLSPLDRADREDAIADWLVDHDADAAHASALAETAVTLDALDTLAEKVPESALDAALLWIANGCATHALAADIEHAATRIHELVASVKGFTHMDTLAATESVDVERGIRDTLRILASKIKAKGASVEVEMEPDLPAACAAGADLNQVWMNLLDNALDAVGEGGRIEIAGTHELDHVVVRVVDDGHGIPEEVLPRIFDPFFTTKPPGQGTGLGLEITRTLLRRHQGDIRVESEPGRTEFIVSLKAEGGQAGG